MTASLGLMDTLPPPMPWLTATVSMPGFFFAAQLHRPSSPVTISDGTPLYDALSMFMYSSDAFSPFMST